MKQLPMTPALAAMIKAAVGQDVDPTDFAVFETIMLNTKPLPGKRGTLFDRAVVEPITLKEMADHINGPNGHLPIVSDHDLTGAPKGRMFHAALDFEDGSLTLRGLFYIDPTETQLIAKLNAGSLDEVSVAFLSREFNCSECGWNYFGLGVSRDFIYNQTCANGHQIGVNGVHGEMVGLSQFIETSLVARGAADKPKIIGKSDSKLAPEGLQLLAASGFEVDELIVQASLGKKEDKNMSEAAITALTAQLTTLGVEKGSLAAELSTAKTGLSASQAEVTRLTGLVAEKDAAIATLTAERDEARTRPDASVATERDEAVSFLHEQLDRLMVVKGEAKLEGAARLSKVSDIKAKIVELTDNLAAILPVGGRSNNGQNAENDAKLAVNPAAFSLRK